MNVKLRIELEKRIVRKLVDDLLAAGFRLSVSLERGHDTQDMLLGSTDAERILDEAFAGDDAHLFVHDPDQAVPLMHDNVLNTIGWVYIVIGNEVDIISDYTVGIERHLAGAFAIVEQYV